MLNVEIQLNLHVYIIQYFTCKFQSVESHGRFHGFTASFIQSTQVVTSVK